MKPSLDHITTERMEAEVQRLERELPEKQDDLQRLENDIGTSLHILEVFWEELERRRDAQN